MIQVIHRALSILEVIASSPKEDLSLSEIADSLQLNHGTCANILKTLVNRNYVEQIGAKKGYKLGYMAYQLTNSYTYYAELKEIAKPLIERLRDSINETVILSIIEGGNEFYYMKQNVPTKSRSEPLKNPAFIKLLPEE